MEIGMFEISRADCPDQILLKGDMHSRFWKNVFETSIESEASDIHVNSKKGSILVRARVNGVIREITEMKDPDPDFLGTLMVRLKKICGLDTSETKMCQDSSFELDSLKVRFRAALAPSLYGESVVLRIIKSEEIPELENLGLSHEQRKALENVIEKKQGMICITGPTGSGKSTLLHASVMKMNRDEMNVISIEDPIERVLPGVVQQQITTKVGWADSIKSAMRQDPDVIYIGEVRDRESAQLALEAAQTGHLVLTTLHTNDVAGVVDRLLHFGIDKQLIAENLIFISAQRLAKTICESCRQPCHGGGFKKGEGCRNCNQTGISGRSLLFEYSLKPDPESILNFEKRKFKKTNLKTNLADEAFKKFKSGKISINEYKGWMEE